MDVFNFWPLDTGKWCQCEKCKQLGTPTDRLFLLLHTVMKEMQEAEKQGRLLRRVDITGPAYMETIEPPTRPLPSDFNYDRISITYFPLQRCYAHAFADPKCTEVNSWHCDSYLTWMAGKEDHYKGAMYIGEYYNVSSLKSLPLVFINVISTDIPWYYQNGARYFHYMHSPTRLWGTWTLNQYLLSKLLWNTKVDSDDIVDEYFANYYPTTSKTTRDFYECIEKAVGNIKAIKHSVKLSDNTSYSLHGSLSAAVRTAKDKELTLFRTEHLKYDRYESSLNDGPDMTEMIGFLTEARKQIDASIVNCRDAVELQRLLEDENRFSYGEATLNLYYRVVRSAMLCHSGNEEAAKVEMKHADELVEYLKGVKDLVCVASNHANAMNGFDQCGIAASYKSLKDKLKTTVDQTEDND